MLGYLRSIFALPPAVLLYLLSEMLFGVGIGMAVILNFHYLELGFTTATIGLSVACYTLTVAAVSYPAGMITDRFGSKFTMLFGSAFVVFGYVLIGYVDTPFELFLAQIVSGFGFSFVIACEFPYIMSLCEKKEDETTAYSLLVSAFTLALALGNILGTKLPALLPSGTTMYQSTVFLIAVAFAIMLIMRCFLPAKSKRVAEEESKRTKKVSWKVIPSKQVMIYVLFATTNGFIFQLLGPFENIILRERYVLSDDTIGYMLAVNSFLLFLASLFTPYLMKTSWRRIGLYSAYALMLICMLLMGFNVIVYAFYLFLLGKGFSGTLFNSFIDSSMMKATADDERGLHSGLRNLFRSAAGALSSTFAGYLLLGGDYNSIYFVTFLILVVQAMLYFFLVRHQLQKDLNEAF
ncbi:putative MFS family arabinose efflux permease [Tumebacillus sp. BK434]|uniref:MFS transporter n=1 Tax=Tumebacillus sp. BK434 TaxID=2512169 RepID=UPI001052B5C8|nr:MFS transporter [Tumebacillus sp. BK434]TCP55445.1 putative MFS family arabinose efflux permease [Tumebacillus sp. BK434]